MGVRVRNPLRNGIVCVLLRELVSGRGRVGRVRTFCLESSSAP